MPSKRKRPEVANADPVKVIGKFLDDVIRALRAEELKVREYVRRESTAQMDARWPVTTSYSCEFRGISVVVNAEKRAILLDGTLIGPEVLDSSMPGAFEDRYTLLKGDCAERLVMQNAEYEAALRADAGKQRTKVRTEAYAGLVEKLRESSPPTRRGGHRTILCGPKRRTRDRKPLTKKR